MQQQALQLSATNMLMRSIQLNHLIENDEAESGVVPNSGEDAEIEEDDG